MAGDAQTVSMTVEVDVATDPISGSLRDGSGPPIAFAGWLELMSAIDTACARATASGDRRPAPD